MTQCPNCGHQLKARRMVREAEHVDTSTLSDKALHAYYKRIAPREDLAFLLKYGRPSPALRAAIHAVSDHPTPKDVERLRDHWRAERLAEERTARRPAVGEGHFYAERIKRAA